MQIFVFITDSVLVVPNSEKKVIKIPYAEYGRQASDKSWHVDPFWDRIRNESTIRATDQKRSSMQLSEEQP